MSIFSDAFDPKPYGILEFDDPNPEDFETTNNEADQYDERGQDEAEAHDG